MIRIGIQSSVGAAKDLYERLLEVIMLCFQRRKKIIFRFLATDPKILTHLFESPDSHTLRASSQTIIYDSWELSEEQRLLVRVALDVWNGSGHVSVSECLQLLNKEKFRELLKAFQKHPRTTNFHSLRHSWR